MSSPVCTPIVDQITGPDRDDDFPASTVCAEDIERQEVLEPESTQGSDDLTPSPLLTPLYHRLGSTGSVPLQKRCSILLCMFSQGTHTRKHRIKLVRNHDKLQDTDDKQLFIILKKCYNSKLRTTWQRYLSLRGLKYIVILEYTKKSKPTRVETDIFTQNEIMYAFNHPDKITSSTKWVDWVFKLKSNHKRKYALEFVEGWKGEKILVLGAIPWLGSCLTAVVWSALTGDVQVALAVASFILAASGSVLALLAILSTVEG